MRNDEKSEKNAEGSYVTCPSDSAIGAVNALRLELAMMSRNLRR